MRLWVNKVGPYFNPQETYAYFDKLPYCQPKGDDDPQPAGEGLGEAILGNDLTWSGTEIRFRGARAPRCLLTAVCNPPEPMAKAPICTVPLTTDDTAAFQKAVQEQYWYELFLGMHDHCLSLALTICSIRRPASMGLRRPGG